MAEVAMFTAAAVVVVVVIVVGDSTRPRAIPLAMSTMKKEAHGFHNFHAWFSSVSPIFIGVVLRSPALRAGKSLLLVIAPGARG